MSQTLKVRVARDFQDLRDFPDVGPRSLRSPSFCPYLLVRKLSAGHDQLYFNSVARVDFHCHKDENERDFTGLIIQ